MSAAKNQRNPERPNSLAAKIPTVSANNSHKPALSWNDIDRV